MLSGFHPLVAGWFKDKFGEPSAPQERGWPAILAGKDTLIAAPTGSGKTLAAFLAGLDQLVRQALTGALRAETQLLYISPLKALSNDVQKNLEEPLAELRARALSQGLALQEIRTAVRTGDTASGERAKMLRKPPHVLVTTPESLYVLLTSEGGRKLLRPVRTVIVDEIHAVARDKRGSHLMLSLERLDALVVLDEPGLRSPRGDAEGAETFPFYRQPSPRLRVDAGGATCPSPRPQRIGLSATQRPIEEIGRFLVGANRQEPVIVDEGHRRAFDLAIEVPPEELQAVASKEQRETVHDRVAQLVSAHRTTLVFVNTRRQVERVCRALSERLGEEAVAAHHGSLARAVRLRAEERLKKAELKAVVATASLELGIDVGAVELVVQLESPRSLSVALQRIGRAGHFKGGTPKGRLFPLTRDQLVECAALVRGIARGSLEVTRIPEQPLDVLAQQIVAEAACRPLPDAELFALVTGAWPYRNLRKDELQKVVQMLCDGVQRRAKDAGARLHRDAVNGVIHARRGSRLAALTSGGAIPDTAQYAVVAEPEGITIGTLDEDFAIESMAGDIFLLGNNSWRIRRVEQGRVRVEDAHGAPPSVPFWNGEAPGRSAELSVEVSSLRSDLEKIIDDAPAAAKLLIDECALPVAGAEQVVRYLAAGRAALGALPTQNTLIAERFFDEGGGMQLIIHAPFGARTNRAFGLALRKSFCRTFDFELQAAATDEGILLSLGPQHSFPLESVFDFVTNATVVEALTQAALLSPMWGARFRWNATRSLSVLRFAGGKKVPFNILRMRVDDLLASVFPAQAQCQEHAVGPIVLPDHPLVNETVRDCLHEAMDLPRLQELLSRIERREVRLIARDTAEPSPLSHEILGGAPYSYLDDAPLEERRARAVSTRRSLSKTDASAIGALDAAAIAEVVSQAWPEARNSEELHEALVTLAVAKASDFRLPPSAFEKLVHERRATWCEYGWVAAECLPLIRALFPEITFEPPIAAAPGAREFAEREDAMRELVRGWMTCLGPTTASELAARVFEPEALSQASSINIALHALESEGVVLRGHFRAGAEEVEWCERTLLSRIHRRTLGRLRREIEPVTTSELVRFLLRWQHVHPGTQLHGVQGALEVISQLEGFQLASSAWESDVLPARIARYEPGLLDQLCLSGEVAWGRLCGEPAPELLESPARRTLPTRATPIALARRVDLDWLLEAMACPGAIAEPGSRPARLIHALLGQRGALFLHEVRAALGTEGGDAQEIANDALRELSWLGLVTCDGFGAVRQIISPARHVLARVTHGMGRWSLLRSGSQELAPPRSPFAEAPAWHEKLARLYLRRYGIVFRDLLAREPRCPPWRDLCRVYRRLEDRGELRGGRFAQAFAGEQFALPEALDALRTVRRTAPVAEERAMLSACDPLNLIGILTPGPRVPAQALSHVLFVDGGPRALQPDERSLA